MEQLDYLVIYQLDSNEQSKTSLPITIEINKNAKADEKYFYLLAKIRENEGLSYDDVKIINILGIYKL